MDLKWTLLLRMTLLGLACWAGVSVYVIASAGRRANESLAENADRLAQRMEIDIGRQMTAVIPGYRFPELSRVAADFPDRLCIRYQSADGRYDELGCSDGDAAEPEAPRWLLALIVRLSPATPTLERPVRLWGSLAGSASFTPDPVRLRNAQWRSARELLSLAGVTIVALDLLAFWLVGHALRPTRQLVAALDRLEDGRLPELPNYSARDFRQIAQGVRRLAERLAKTSAARDLLTAKLIRLQEDERRELTHVLHEEVGQCVTGLAAHCATLRLTLAGGEALQAADLEPLDEAIGATQNALRSLLLRLRPPAFEQQGLASALRDLITGWRGRLRGQPQLALHADDAELADVDADRALCVYRVVQEGLNNIARHAGSARRAEVTVRRDGDAIIARIDNDLSEPSRVQGSGLGLRLLAERVRALGGEFNAQPTADHFAVQARLPVPT